mmetsp:Transcript_14578/g.37256  ORF Transcript_14578/g.37256 Transcript_14578/m.37256 type:complete len:118 (-) Transcript_14578:815-1168(-)
MIITARRKDFGRAVRADNHPVENGRHVGGAAAALGSAAAPFFGSEIRVFETDHGSRRVDAKAPRRGFREGQRGGVVGRRCGANGQVTAAMRDVLRGPHINLTTRIHGYSPILSGREP